MKLVHWSADIVTKVHGRRQYDPVADGHDRRGRGDKPNGFWISDEQYPADGWRAYNDFRRWGLRYRHEVTLVPNARILYIRTPEELQAFTDKYGYNLVDRICEARGEEPPRIGSRFDRPMVDSIHWRKLTRKYHGIIITPYQYSKRLDMGTQWYYTWDCASGCIWNPRAIASVTMVREYKAPRKPTYWEMRRKRKRQLQAMKDLTANLEAMRKEMREEQPA